MPTGPVLCRGVAPLWRRLFLTVTAGAAAELAARFAAKSPALAAAPRVRLRVRKGGCAGFSYSFAWCTGTDSSDAVVVENGCEVVVDSSSRQFLKNAVVDYRSSLERSEFFVSSNDAARRSCPCGTSFQPAPPDAAPV
eukprot:Polyplicarium_translucidae@DN2547_c0_g1_i5.p2